jgi:hypothetical protein
MQQRAIRIIAAIDLAKDDAGSDGVFPHGVADDQFTWAGVADERFQFAHDWPEILDALADRDGAARSSMDGNEQASLWVSGVAARRC